MNSFKFLKLILIGLSIMILAGCGSGGGSTNTGNAGKSNIAQDKIEAFAKNGSKAPSVQDYIDAGISGVDTDNLKEINTVVEKLTAEDVNSKEKVQALADKLGVSLICETNQHKEKEVCVSNTKNIDCEASKTPDNATKVNAQVKITWNNNAWSNAANCEWSCNNGYHKDNNACAIDVPNQSPLAKAGDDQTITEGNSVTLTSTSTDADGTITSWEWKEGDAILSDKKSFSKNDFSLGEHTITLTVTDNDDAKSSDSITIIIASNDPQVKNETQASMFLNRSTFGPTKTSIQKLVSKGTYKKWLEEQFNKPATLHLPQVKALATKMCANLSDEGEQRIDSWEISYPRQQIWWEVAVKAEDQLRQRIAFALSEIMVISTSEGLGLSELHLGATSYYDLFVKHAFGNFRDLLGEVTLHPAMGDFLSLTRNQKENIEEGVRPDENYAREILQLFTIGVHELNLDGTERLDSNKQPIPTYNQKTIEEFAKVFTGWSYSDIDWDGYFAESDHTVPLKAFEEYHDTSEKKLLNGAISPANKTAKVDLEFALNNIFAHPNVAPFISAQLIQRLVTSNPSPAYIERVAKVFNDNGKGIKGDLKAVAQAVLLDVEALSTKKTASFGKLREPLLRISHLWRNFPIQAITREGHYWEEEKTCGQGNYQYYQFWDSLDAFEGKIGQGPLQAKTVFNFFTPDFSPNGMLNDKGLKAPEFQIINENTFTGLTNLTYYMVTEFSDADGISDEVDVISGDFAKLNLNQVTVLAKKPKELLDYLSLVLLNKNMSPALRTIILEHLNQTNVYPKGIDGQFIKAREAIVLIINSPEYLIQQ